MKSLRGRIRYGRSRHARVGPVGEGSVSVWSEKAVFCIICRAGWDKDRHRMLRSGDVWYDVVGRGEAGPKRLRDAGIALAVYTDGA